MTAAVPQLRLGDYTTGSAAQRQQFENAAFSALRRYGFLVLRDHQVPVELLDQAYQLATQLFSLPSAQKLGHRGGLRGYTPFGTEHAKNHPYPDLKEFWQIGREYAAHLTPAESLAANIWPAQNGAAALPQFRDTFLKLYDSLDETARLLLEALTGGLQLPRDYFDARVRGGNSILRLIHYPPVPPEADARCIRSAAHEDINFLTILVAARGAGLELRDTDGRWLSVETQAHDLIVNSGDMLARLTNDVIPAKTHRVVNPAGPNVSRYSMPFFMHPTSTTSLACLPSCVGSGAKYADISAGEFLDERLREIGLKPS